MENGSLWIEVVNQLFKGNQTKSAGTIWNVPSWRFASPLCWPLLGSRIVTGRNVSLGLALRYPIQSPAWESTRCCVTA